MEIDSLTTPALQTYNRPLGGIIKMGAILCNKCQASMMDLEVCRCGSTRCHITIYSQGKHYSYRRDSKGDTFRQPEAVLFLANINVEIAACKEKGITFKPDKYTDKAIRERKFENQYEFYLKEKKTDLDKDELSPEHYRHLVGYYRNQFRFFYDYDVKQIDLETLTKFKDGLIGKKKTIRNVLNALHAFFNWLYGRGTIARVPPFPSVKGNDAHRRQALRSSEQEKALANLPEEHRDIFQFMMMTGLRHGEVVAILVESVNIDRRYVWVERRRSGSKERPGSKNNEVMPVPLNDTALAIVMKHTKNKFPKDYLFINPSTRRPYTQWFISNLWRKHSGTDLTSYEATRHSFCSNLKADIRTAQRLMRHRDQRSTDNYFHAYMEDLVQVVQQMDNVKNLKEHNESITKIGGDY